MRFLSSFSSTQKKAVFLLAGISGLRMCAFFMLLPLLHDLALLLQGSTPFLLGLSMGIYGLVQACFYLPWGVLSDKVGRKPIILIGLLCLLAGSLWAARSSNINHFMAARALQGLGAISAVLSAYVADMLTQEQRPIAMGMIGGAVGLSFPLSLIIAPSLYAALHYAGFFYALSFLIALAFACALYLPKQNVACPHYQKKDLQQGLKHAWQFMPLRSLMMGVIFLHALSMMFFYVISKLLTQLFIPTAQHYWVYLPILFLSFAWVMTKIRQDKKASLSHKAPIQGNMQKTLSHGFAMGSLLLAYGLMMLAHYGAPPLQIFSTAYNVYAGLVLLGIFFYFVGFNYLEVMQPSLVANYSQAHLKGTSMGTYYTLQALGMFIGGALAGLIEKWQPPYLLWNIFSVSLSLVLIWGLFDYLIRKNHVGK